MEYDGKHFTDLMRDMTSSQIRKAIKTALKSEAEKAREIAVGSLRSSGLHVQGDLSTWESSVRSYVYSKAGGFLITAKPRGKKGFHRNRFYDKTGRELPIVMWAEEGTRPRQTRTASKVFDRARKGHNTGSLQRYGFIEKAEPQMVNKVQADLPTSIEAAVVAIAKKCGF